MKGQLYLHSNRTDYARKCIGDAPRFTSDEREHDSKCKKLQATWNQAVKDSVSRLRTYTNPADLVLKLASVDCFKCQAAIARVADSVQQMWARRRDVEAVLFPAGLDSSDHEGQDHQSTLDS